MVRRKGVKRTSSKYLDSSAGDLIKEMIAENSRFKEDDAWRFDSKESGKIHRECSSLPTMLLFYNYSRGVAKTASVKEVGFNLSARGYHVLLLDLTGQANLSSSFKVYHPTNLSGYISDVLLMGADNRRKRLSDVIIRTEWPNLDIAPSNHWFINIDYMISEQQDGAAADRILLHSIQDLLEERCYDFILVDCVCEPDTMFRNAIASLQACNRRSLVILPSTPDSNSVRLMGYTFEFIDAACKDSGQTRAKKLVLWTRVNEIIKTDRMAWARFKERYPDVPVFKTMISNSVAARHANNAYVPLSIYARHSKPARCYELLTSEILALTHGDALAGETQMICVDGTTKVVEIKLLWEEDALLPMWRDRAHA